MHAGVGESKKLQPRKYLALSHPVECDFLDSLYVCASPLTST